MAHDACGNDEGTDGYNEDYLADYEAFTSGLAFRIRQDADGAASSERGRFAEASEIILAGTDLLEEVPLVSWPRARMIHSKVNNGIDFCETCLQELKYVQQMHRASQLKSEHSFCSGRCAAHVSFAVLRKEELRELRLWQLANLSESAVITVEAVARCAARVLGDALARLPAALVGSTEMTENEEHTVDTDVLSAALENCLAEALRPFQRFAAPPEGVVVELEGLSESPSMCACSETGDIRNIDNSQDWSSAVTAALRPGLHYFCKSQLGSQSDMSDMVTAALEEAVLVRERLHELLQSIALNVKELSIGDNRRPAASIFVMLSCFNHSCEPNLRVLPRSDASVHVQATRTVLVGEELTVNYMSAWDRSLKDREQQLKTRWLIKCRCSRCSVEKTIELDDFQAPELDEAQGRDGMPALKRRRVHSDTPAAESANVSKSAIVSIALKPDYVNSDTYAVATSALLRDGVVVLPRTFEPSELAACYRCVKDRFVNLQERLQDLASSWKQRGLLGVPGGHQFLEIVERDGGRFDFQIWRHGQLIESGEPNADALRASPVFSWADPTVPRREGEPALRRESGGRLLAPLLDAMLGESSSAKLLFAGIVVARSASRDGTKGQIQDENDHQEWHRDGAPLYDFDPGGVPLPPHCLQVFVPFEELQSTNGPTEFRLGSHRRREDDCVGLEEAIVAPLGSVYIFDYRIYHRGRANIAGTDRFVAYFVFSRSWFVDIKNYATTRTMASLEAELKK